jgi:hypothetical protein
MPLDTRIALGAQPLQLENQLAQYGQAVGIQNAMQQNQLGQMQMSAAQRTMQEEEGAKSFLSTNPDLNNVENQRRLLAFGKTGLAYGKAFLDQRKASQDSDKTAAEILGLSQKNFTAINPPMRAAAGGIPGITAYVEAMYADPVLGALARKIKTKEQALQENIAIFTKDPDQWVTAHASLEGQQLLDALKMNAERVAEKARISSLPPLPGAVPTGTVNAASATMVEPSAAAAPVGIDQGRGVVAFPVKSSGGSAEGTITIAPDVRIDAKFQSQIVDKLKNYGETASLKEFPGMRWTLSPNGFLTKEPIPAESMPLNALAPAAAAAPVNALAGNEATLQAIAAESKKLRDRLDVLDRMPFSKGVEREMKDKEARLKELTAPINLRADGTAIIPSMGTLTAAPAPSDIFRLQREEATLRANGDIAGANVIANRIKKLNELTDNRTAAQKEQAILDDPNATVAQKATATSQLAKLNQLTDNRTAAQKEQAILDDPRSTAAQKATATSQLAKLNQLTDNRTASQKEQAVLDDPNATAAQRANATSQLAKLNNIPAKDTPARIQEYEYAKKNNGYTGSFFDFVNPEKDPALVKEYEYAVKKGYKGSIADFKTLGPAASPAPAFIAVQSPTDPSKTIYVPGPTAGGLTPAAVVEKPLTALQAQKLKAEKAADTAHVTASQSTANELEKLTNELVGSEDGKIKPHPGLGGITGYAAYLPSLPKGDARQAQQKLDTFKGKILALGREMASQNGKLGNMAVQEWKFVSDAVQALDPKAGNLDQQMRDVVRQAKAFARNQKSKFESTYEDTDAAAPAAGRGVDTNNPLLK